MRNVPGMSESHAVDTYPAFLYFQRESYTIRERATGAVRSIGIQFLLLDAVLASGRAVCRPDRLQRPTWNRAKIKSHSTEKKKLTSIAKWGGTIERNASSCFILSGQRF